MRLKALPLSIVTLLVLILISAGEAVAGRPEPSPSARFDQTVYEFATVIAGTHVSHRFDILNKGEATLNIIGVYAA